MKLKVYFYVAILFILIAFWIILVGKFWQAEYKNKINEIKYEKLKR